MPGQKPIRLPPLKTLRVHNPQRKVENPCIAIMSSVLGRLQTFPPGPCRSTHRQGTKRNDGGLFIQLQGDTLWNHYNKRLIANCDILPQNIACWASAGYNATGCLAVENQLRACMDGPGVPTAPASTINYHLSRMQKYVISQPKKK
jgi:hypothetical protein